MESSTYDWNLASSYVQNPPFLSDKNLTENNLKSIKGQEYLLY